MKNSNSRGALFLIGGGAEKVYADFVRIAGEDAHFVVLTHASEVPKQRRDTIAKGLIAAGARRITAFLPSGYVTRITAENGVETGRNTRFEKIAVLPEDVGAIFISGGGQDRLVELLTKNGMAQQVRDANRRGVPVAGTSAGAAAAAFVMMNDNSDEWSNDRSLIKVGAIELDMGLCLIPGIVFDTHFGERKRQTRLRMALGMLDGVIGIGMDEDTTVCIIGDQCEVFGVGKVRVYTRGGGNDFVSIARGAIETEYVAGEKFTLPVA